MNVPNAYIEKESDVKDTLDDPKGKETEELEIDGPYDGEALTVLKETKSAIEKKWLQNNIFCSRDNMNRQACTVVIDGGSCENIISQAIVNRLQLKVRKHHPYFADGS